MRLSSLGISILIHLLVLGILVGPGGSAVRRAPPQALRTMPPVMALITLSRKPPKIDQGTVPMPRRTPAPPRPTPTPPPKQVKVAARPSPTPKPTPKPTEDPHHKVYEALRKYKEYAGLTDEQIRRLPLPPGMKDWGQVLAMTQSLDKLNWDAMPPQLGSQSATASPLLGFFGWAPPGLSPTTDYMGGPKRERVNGKWHFAFQYYGTVMVAEWDDGGAIAKVAYYPFGGKPDQAKTFPIPVMATDEDLSGQMIAQYTLVSMGQPPMPVAGSPPVTAAH